jgi:hypothetical protein
MTPQIEARPDARVAPDRLIVEEPDVAVSVPPQLLNVCVSTTNPAGRLSVKATLVSGTSSFVFWMTTVKLAVLLSGIVSAPNPLLIVGGATTVMLAAAVLPVPLLEVTVTELFLTPAVVPVTLTFTSHSTNPAPIVPPERLIVFEPAVAVAVPPQLLNSPLGVATISPAGKLSVNPTPVSETTLGFTITSDRDVVPLSGIVAAPNALLTPGGDATCALPTRSTAMTEPSTRNAIPSLSFFTPSPLAIGNFLADHNRHMLQFWRGDASLMAISCSSDCGLPEDEKLWKIGRGFVLELGQAASFTISTRRSPDSHFEPKDCWHLRCLTAISGSDGV